MQKWLMQLPLQAARVLAVSISGLAFCALTVSCGAGGLEADIGSRVIRLSETGDPSTIDPHRAGDVVSSRHCGMVYEQLYEYDYFARPQTVVPCLAAALPTISDNGLVYTIPIRKGVFFQDDKCFPGGKGRELKASDVVYSFKRFASVPDTPGWWAADGKIEGLNAFRDLAQNVDAGLSSEEEKKQVRSEVLTRDVSGLKVIDDYTVQITLAQPDPYFVYINCMSYFAIIAKEAVDHYGEQFFYNPVGTGPFMLDYWDFNRELKYVRNPNYRDISYPEPPIDLQPVDGMSSVAKYMDYSAGGEPIVGKQLPVADVVIFRVIKETSASYLEFKEGKLDAIGLTSDEFTASIQDQDLTPEMKAAGIELVKYNRPAIEYLSFNMEDPMIGKDAGEQGAAMRKAMSYAFDAKAYIKRYRNGRGSLATMMVTPSFAGFDPDYQYEFSKYDPEKGRELLKQAGFKLREDGDAWIAVDPRTNKQAQMTVLCRGTTQTSKDMARSLVFAGRKVGIDVSAPNMQFSEFLKRQREGTGQAYNAGWVMDYPEPQNVLQLLYGKYAVKNGINAARYKSDEFDEKFDELVAIDVAGPGDDPEAFAKQKRKLVVDMHKILDKDCPWALIYFDEIYRLQHGWHSPVAPNAFAYNLHKYYSSDSRQRAEKVNEWIERPVWPALIFFVLVGGLVAVFFVRVVRNE